MFISNCFEDMRSAVQFRVSYHSWPVGLSLKTTGHHWPPLKTFQTTFHLQYSNCLFYTNNGWNDKRLDFCGNSTSNLFSLFKGIHHPKPIIWQISQKILNWYKCGTQTHYTYHIAPTKWRKISVSNKVYMLDATKLHLQVVYIGL